MEEKQEESSEQIVSHSDTASDIIAEVHSKNEEDSQEPPVSTNSISIDSNAPEETLRRMFGDDSDSRDNDEVPIDEKPTEIPVPNEVDASFVKPALDQVVVDQKNIVAMTASGNLHVNTDIISGIDDSPSESVTGTENVEIDGDSLLSEEVHSEREAPTEDDVTANSMEQDRETDQTNTGSLKNSPDESDFFGFDSETIEMSLEKTNELIQTLHNKETGVARTNLLVDGHVTSKIEWATAAEKKSANITSGMVEADDQSGCISEQSNENFQSAEISSSQKEMKNSRKPNPVHPVLGIPVNIFDETVPSGSKRVKKKRKFFGDFEESDSEKTTRKSSSSRPNENGVKLLNNISGENKENFINDEKLKVEPVLENDTTNQNKTKRSYTFDISNPLFKEPFKHGWKREICYRNLPEGSKSKPAYVSYYSPEGKKFKTIRHIVEILPPDSELSMQHFTFSVQRIFNEPSEFEILRDAKPRTDLNDTDAMDHHDHSNDDQSTAAQITLSDPVKSVSKKKLATPGSKLVIKKPKYLKVAGEGEDDSTQALLSSMPSSTTPKIVIKGSSLNSSRANTSKPKSSSAKKDKTSVNKKQEKNAKKSLLSAENVFNSTREYTKSFDTSTPIFPKNISNTPSCSINCPLALGSIPTLQCTVCLSLYHFECHGVDASQPIHGYVCKSCRSRVEVQSKLLLAVSQTPSSSSHTLGYGGCNAATVGSRALTKNTKIVDGVTTWLPPSSNVQLSSRHATLSSTVSGTLDPTQTTTLLQSVLELDGKRYIIVPKESIVSISPNTSSILNTYAGSYEERPSEATHRSPDGSRAASAAVAPCHAESVRDYGDVNSAGVLLVPVMPRGSDPYCDQMERGSSKRKLSEDADTPPAGKMAKLSGEWSGVAGYCYRSALTLSNVAQLYDPLTLCLKYITVRDLLRVSMSCKYLNRIASEPSLWTTVRLKNSKVRDWEGFARTLRKYATKKLDMRKMLLPSAAADVNTMWSNFLEKITSVTSLEHIEFSRCNAEVVETVARTCPNLVVINAVQLRNGNGLSIESFTKLKQLRELRLKGSTGLNIEPRNVELDFQCKEVMRVLSLTSIKNLNSAVVEAVGALNNLNVLELGECHGESVDELAASIARLNNLQKLRLEQVTNLEPHFNLFKSLKDLQQLKSLELVNIEVRMGFCEAIAECTNIENLLIIPLYKTESATSNRLIMDSLPALSKSLKSFVWGLTHELIRATDLYATQYLEKPSGGNEETKTLPVKGPDSIPIVKRISKHPEVDILSVRNLEKMLSAVLPRTRIKVIIVASVSTWRQTLADVLK